MAGSYRHVITDQGNLASPERVNGMLENGGDVYEAVEEMYGMIWWLGFQSRDPHQWWLEMSIPERVEDAQKHYKEGLRIAKTALRGRDGG